MGIGDGEGMGGGDGGGGEWETIKNDIQKNYTDFFFVCV